MRLEDKAKTYGFEKSFCMIRPEVWLNEARTLLYSADVLGSFEAVKNAHLWQSNETFKRIFPGELTNRASFNWRVQRMLWAYGFENVLKCIILIGHRIANPAIDEVPLQDIKSHKLTWLAGKAGFNLSEKQTFYLKILEKCALWAGRYPMPAKETDVYEKRESLPSNEALLQRSRELHEKQMRGEIPRTFSESDVLQGAIGFEESEVCTALREEMLNKASELLRSSRSRQEGGVLLEPGADRDRSSD